MTLNEGSQQKKPSNIPTSRWYLFLSLSFFLLNMDVSESPLPKHPDLFGSFPSAAAGEKYVGLLLVFNSVLTMISGDASRLKVLRRLEARLSTNQIRSVLRQRFSFLPCKGYGGMGGCHKYMVVFT